jgi:hypothetical protein
VSASVFTERVGLDAPRPGQTSKARQRIPALKTATESLLRWTDEGVHSYLNSLVEFTTDSIQQQGARGLVKIDQISAEDSEYRRHHVHSTR